MVEKGKGKSKGWKEEPDDSGKAPRHKAVATRRNIKGVSRVPMVRKHKHIWEGCDDLIFISGKNKGSAADIFCTENDCNKGAFTDEHGHAIINSIAEVGFYKDEDWKEVAKRELEKELGVKTKVSAYGNEEDSFNLESTTGEGSNGEREWAIFKNEDEARSAAITQVKEDLENEPILFNQNWLQNFITISDTDRNIIAGEEADDLVEDMEDNEAKEKAREKEYEKIKVALKDPVQYFVGDHGIYSREELMKQSFIQIDIEKASEDAIRTDGVAHFLDHCDSSEVELPSGAVAYGTN